jgi:hypothetical protein
MMTKPIVVLGAALAAFVMLARPAFAQGGVAAPDSARHAPVTAPAAPAAAPVAADTATDESDSAAVVAAPVDTVARPPIETIPPSSENLGAARGSGPSSAEPQVGNEAPTLLGIRASTTGTARDTLGLLISPVTPGGPGDRGGIDPGNRLAEVNNVNLRIAAGNVGRPESEETAQRLLSRALQGVRPGDYVRIRLFGDGRYRSMAIQTPGPEGAKSAPPTQLQGIVDGIGSLRAQLDRLMQDREVPVSRDTLLRAERELGAIQRRLRAAQETPRHGDANVGSLPGLRFAIVANELKDYFGEGSAGGFLILDCDLSWDPLRNGDVILRVNDEPVTFERLKVALDPQRQSRIDFLRRGRYLMITLHPHE